MPHTVLPWPDALAVWHWAGGAVSYQGHDIFVRSGGEPGAPVLLLIHGFPTASWDFAPLWAGLAARWRVLTLDMLGFGFSAKPRHHAYAKDSAEPRLRSVCLLNGGIFPEAHRARLIQRLLSSPAGPLVARLSSRTSFAISMRRIFARERAPTRTELDGFWTLVTHGNGRAVLAPVNRYRHERLRFIVGTADPIAGAATAARYRQLVPRPDVVELAGVGHYPQLEAPEHVLAAYAEFRATGPSPDSGSARPWRPGPAC